MKATESSSTPASSPPSSGRAKRSAGGFTLLEVMVALAVIAFAFVALLGLHGRNIALVSRVDNFSRATLLARELMTQMQFENYEDLGDADGSFEYYPQFRWERAVNPTVLETVKEVRLRVIWNESTPNACELLYFIRDPNL